MDKAHFLLHNFSLCWSDCGEEENSCFHRGLCVPGHCCSLQKGDHSHGLSHALLPNSCVCWENVRILETTEGRALLTDCFWCHTSLCFWHFTNAVTEDAQSSLSEAAFCFLRLFSPGSSWSWLCLSLSQRHPTMWQAGFFFSVRLAFLFLDFSPGRVFLFCFVFN